MAGSVGQYTQAWFVFDAIKGSVGSYARSNDGGSLGMGYFNSTSQAQNDELTWDIYLDSVTWKISHVYFKSAAYAICTFQFQGVTQGSTDMYNATSLPNNYSEVTNLTPVAGVTTLKLLFATKNASSSAYGNAFSSLALIRTGGTPSTPNGTDTPGYTWEWIPWMGWKTATTGGGTLNREQDSTLFGGGRVSWSGSTQNDAFSTDGWLENGTYKIASVYGRNTSYGIASHQLGGSTQGTIDHYSVSADGNNYSEITGVAVTAGVKTYQIIDATKNASSAGYNTPEQSLKWIRTGA